MRVSIQEVFNAVSMCIPLVYLLAAGGSFAELSDFPAGIVAMKWATGIHCGASFCFHMESATTTRAHQLSFWRLADFVFMHVCCFSYGWAVSRGDTTFNAVSLLVNVYCAAQLTHKWWKQKAIGQVDSLKVVGCIMLYTTAMLWQHYFYEYCGTLFFYLIGGSLWVMDERLHGWGHGFFHLMLVPCTHFVLNSMVAR